MAIGDPEDEYIVDKHELEQAWWQTDEDEDWDDFWASLDDAEDEEKDEDVFIPAE